MIADGQLLAMFQFQSILPRWQTLWQTHTSSNQLLLGLSVARIGEVKSRLDVFSKCPISSGRILHPKSEREHGVFHHARVMAIIW